MASVNLSILLCLSLSSTYSQEKQLEGKIVHGSYVKINKFPHAVYLEMMDEQRLSYICGSSVINQYYLVSAAHCVNDIGFNGIILAFAGHENIRKASMVRKNITPIIHRRYDPVEVENDIALLLLSKKLPLGKGTQRIIIMKNFPRIKTGSVAGWGVINDLTDEETLLLKTVRQTVKTRKYCRDLELGPGMFCAGTKRASAPRPAPGDSGSGLITKNYQLIGLISYRLERYPALPVYTNVSYYYRWIKAQTKAAFCKNRIRI